MVSHVVEMLRLFLWSRLSNVPDKRLFPVCYLFGVDAGGPIALINDSCAMRCANIALNNHICQINIRLCGQIENACRKHFKQQFVQPNFPDASLRECKVN